MMLFRRLKHLCRSCNKICKSKGGLARHIRAKHTLLNETSEGKNTPGISKEIVEDLFKKAESKIKDNLYGEEIASICKNLKPSALCVDVRGELRGRFSKKLNQDTLVSELYKHLSKEPERLVNQPTTGNERWSVEQIRIAASLLFIHIPEFLVATRKSQTSEQTKDVPEVDEREYGPLSYLMGSIISKMFRTSKFRKTKSILESTNREELQDLLQSMKRPDNEYILSLSRGGLWTPCEDLIGIGFEMEKTFRCETVAFDVTKPIPICELQTRILENPKVKSLWSNIVQECPYSVYQDCLKVCLENIIFLYLKIRAFSFSRDMINKYKKQNCSNGKKALRKTLQQKSEDQS